MLALGLCLTLFAFWTVVGYALVVALSERATHHRMQALLLGPAVGIVLTVIPLFVFSRSGVSVRAMALPILSALTLLTFVLLLWRRPAVPWRQAAGFGGVLAVALLLTGRPMLEFGLHWMSYCNDDMANYCLSARWLKDHGVADAPTPQETTSGTDYGKIYWMLHVPAMSRVGCELIVSWTSTLTGVSEHQAFNPVILAFHLALLASLAALVLREPDMYPVALIACALVSLSAMNTMGTLLQVIAQVVGLAVLAAWATLLMRPFEGLSRGEIVRHAVLVGIVGAGQAIVYAEVLPFLFLAFCAYAIGRAVSGDRPWRLMAVTGIGAVVGLILLRSHALTVIAYIKLQSAGGSVGDDPLKSLMPYFLVPAGLANLWGYQHITNLGPEPWLSLTIALGLVLLLAGLVAAAWGTWRGHAVAAFALAMIALSPYLFFNRTGFGLFKLAMFVQPFLLGTVAVAWCAYARKPLLRYVPLALLGLSGVYVQQWYVNQSRGVHGTFSLIPFASPSHVDEELAELVDQHKGARIVADPYNVVLAKFQAMHAHGQGTTLIFPSNDFFRSVMTYRDYLSTAGPLNLKRAAEIFKAQDVVFPDAAFDMHDPAFPGAVNKFHPCKVAGLGDDAAESAAGTLMVQSRGVQGVYNRRHLPAPPSFRDVKPADGANFNVIPYRDARNHLISIASDLSQPYYAADPTRIGVYQLEREPFYFRGSTMAGLGRYLMFQVVNPTEGVRVVMSMTGTYLADGANALPAGAVAIGEDKRWELGATGRGAARLFSPPLVPQRIDGRDYLMLDMGRTGVRFPWPRGGLMMLYGRDVALDRRVLVGFARDVSAVSDEEYKRLAPPAVLQRFPMDLAHPDLEFSGLYEDGWASEHAFASLSPTGPGSTAGPGAKAVVAKGTVPEIGGDKAFRTEATLLLDGKEIARQELAPGPFELRGLVPPVSAADAPGAESGRRRVELRFGRWQSLPDGDRRPVAARLQMLGFVSATPADHGLARQ